MNFTSQDIAIIERALRAAMHSEKDEYRNRDYREVLFKLKESASQLGSRFSDSKVERMPDGIRFDYDDSSDVL